MAKDVVFSVSDIPKEHSTTEDQINYLQGEIKEVAKAFNKEGKASVESAVRLGSMLNEMKGLVNGQKKGSWEKYRDTELTSVNKRTGQRCMSLARRLGPVLEKSAKLSWAGKTRLLELANLAKRLGKDVEDLLEENEVSLDFDHKKVKKVKVFHDQIDSLIYDLKSSEEKLAKKKKQVSVKNISELGEIVETCSSLLKEKEGRKSLLYGLTSAGINEIIEKLKQLRDQLKNAKTKLSDKEADKESN